MFLNLKGSLGDHIILTGIPEAYYKLFGSKIGLSSKKSGRYSYFWMSNPYVDDKASGPDIQIAFNQNIKDYMIYYPVRVFYDLTGVVVDRELVQPNIYMKRAPEKGLIIVNEEAGWPTRRGYPYYQELVDELKKLGYKILQIKHSNYKDCNKGLVGSTLINIPHIVKDPSIIELTDYMRRAEVYIGYDSGLCQIAGALRMPYVVLTGSVPPINIIHDSCIYYTDGFCPRCTKPNCNKLCIKNTPNFNAQIIEVIKLLR